jgi:hypothetical protein
MIEIFMAALSVPQVKYIVYFIAADFILAVAASIKTGEFRLGYLATFLRSKLIPSILGYLASILVATVQPDLSMLPTLVWGAIMLSLTGDVMAALKELGLPIPDALTNFDVWFPLDVADDDPAACVSHISG